MIAPIIRYDSIKMINKTYNQILIYEEGSIDEEKCREALEACGVYLLPVKEKNKERAIYA